MLLNVDCLHTITMIFLFVYMLLPSCVFSHGSMRDPPARNVVYNSNYCPDCLNSGGSYDVYGSGKAKYGVCGDQYNSKRDHEAGGKFAKGKIVKQYRSGQTIPLKFSFSANHMGRMQVSLCVLPNSKLSAQEERRYTTQSCFNKYKLRRADNDKLYTFLPSNTAVVNVKYKLPKVTCKHCVIQWQWITGNSCCPPETPFNFCEKGVGKCFTNGGIPELWNNCADVSIS